MEAKRKADLKGTVGLPGGIGHGGRLRSVAARRLLAQDVLSVLKGCDGDWREFAVDGCHYDGIDAGIIDHAAPFRHMGGSMLAGEVRGPLLDQVGDRYKLRPS
jgi:hypothetical protein